MWVQFFPQLNTLRNTNTHKLLKQSMLLFTPFVVTADGALGLEAKTFIGHLAEKNSCNLATSLTVKYWAMCVQECFLLYFVLQICAFAAVE